MDLTRCAVQSLPLYASGGALWRQATDSAGAVDVAVLRIQEDRLPAGIVMSTFDASDLETRDETLTLGDPLAIVGFPLGFHDTVHHLAVARRASIASAYGFRFQQQGYFLTDARTHRGSSGSPVVRRRTKGHESDSVADWQLLGVHSTRMDMQSRDTAQDESLGLNCAWYADVLHVLTQSDAFGGEPTTSAVDATVSNRTQENIRADVRRRARPWRAE